MIKNAIRKWLNAISQNDWEYSVKTFWAEFGHVHLTLGNLSARIEALEKANKRRKK